MSGIYTIFLYIFGFIFLAIFSMSPVHLFLVWAYESTFDEEVFDGGSWWGKFLAVIMRK